MSRDTLPMICIETIECLLTELDSQSTLRLQNCPAEYSLLPRAIEYGFRLATDAMWQKLGELRDNEAVHEILKTDIWEKEEP